MKLFVAYFLAIIFVCATSLPTTPVGLPCAKPKHPSGLVPTDLISNIRDAIAPVQPVQVTINGNVTIEIFNTTQMCCNQQNATGGEGHTPTPPKLPDGYVPISEGDGYKTAVKLHKTELIFNEARKICAGEGAFVAYATSKEEEDSFLQIMDDNSIVDIWTGIHDLFEKSDYSTILGEVASEVAYFNWRPGQPDNAGGNERCTHFRRAGLNDISCTSNKFVFICKIKVPLSS